MLASKNRLPGVLGKIIVFFFLFLKEPKYFLRQC